MKRRCTHRQHGEMDAVHRLPSSPPMQDPIYTPGERARCRSKFITPRLLQVKAGSVCLHTSFPVLVPCMHSMHAAIAIRGAATRLWSGCRTALICCPDGCGVDAPHLFAAQTEPLDSRYGPPPGGTTAPSYPTPPFGCNEAYSLLDYVGIIQRMPSSVATCHICRIPLGRPPSLSIHPPMQPLHEGGECILMHRVLPSGAVRGRQQALIQLLLLLL